MYAHGFETDADSVWHKTTSLKGVEAFEDPSLAKIGPFPKSFDGWTAVKYKEVVEVGSTATLPTKVGPVDDSARPLHITIRKNHSTNVYEPWINGFLMESEIDSATESVYMLPPFDRVYKSVLEGGKSASCVTPVVISLLVEKNVRPPEYAEVASRQQYIGNGPPGDDAGALNEDIVYQVEKLSGTSRLHPTVAVSSRGNSVAAPYPCQFPKEPRVVIYDMTPFKAQNTRMYKRAVDLVFWGLISFSIALVLSRYTVFASAFATPAVTAFGNMLLATGANTGTLYRWIVDHSSIAASVELFNSRWDTFKLNINTFFGDATTGNLDTTPLSDIVSDNAEFIKNGASKWVTRPATLTEKKFHFTLPQIAEIVDSIRPGGINHSKTSRVLIDWITSTSPESSSGHKNSRALWKAISSAFGGTANFFGSLGGVVPYAVNKPIETNEFRIDAIRGYTLRHDIVVSITDTHSCADGVPMLVFRARTDEAVRAGLLHIGIDDDAKNFHKSINAAINRLESNKETTGPMAFDTVLGIRTGFSKMDWMQKNLDKVSSTTSKQQSSLDNAGVLAGFHELSRKNLIGGLKALRQQVLESNEVEAFLKDILERRSFYAFKAVETDMMIVRTLPQPLRHSYMIKHDATPPNGKDILYTSIDNEDIPSVNSNDAKFTHMAALRGVSASFDASLVVLSTVHDGVIRPLNRQCWRGEGAFNLVDSTLSVTVEARRNHCFTTYSPFSFGFPSDVIVKISEDNLSSSQDDELVTSWVTRRDGTPSDPSSAYDPDPFNPSYQQAMLAFSDMLVDVQKVRVGLPGSTAVHMSVLEMAGRRLANVKKLFECLVTSRKIYGDSSRSKAPFDTDLSFVAVPGGVDLFRLLARLRFIRITDVRSFEEDERVIDRLIKKGTIDATARAIVERSRKTQPLPLSLSCREFVSRASFDRQSVHSRSALNNPYSMDLHVQNGMNAFQAALSTLTRGIGIPAMAMFVMREGAVELASQNKLTSIKSETYASANAARIFASSYEQNIETNNYTISRSLSTAVVMNRPTFSSEFLSLSDVLDQSLVEHFTALRRSRSVVYSASAMGTADIIKVMRTRNAMYNVSLDGFLSNNNDVATLGPRPAAISVVDELVQLFEKQSVLHGPDHSMSVKIPFAAGENTRSPLIPPLSTTSMFDTAPIRLDSLTNAIALIASEKRDGSVLIGIVSDRSPTLLQQGVSTTRPFEIDMAKSGAAGADGGIATSIIMSQTVDYDTIMYNDPRPETVYEQNNTVTKPDIVSEITWNTERIVQAAMATMGAFGACTEYKNEPLHIEIQAPVGWVVSPTELNHLVDTTTLAGQLLDEHKSTQLECLRGVFSAMWSIITDIRTQRDGPDDTPAGAVPAAAPAVAAAADSGAAPAAAPAADSGAGVFALAAVAAPGARAIATLQTTVDIGGFQFAADAPAADAPAAAADVDGDGNTTIPAEQLADMNTQPDSLLPEKFLVDGQNLYGLFDSMSDTDELRGDIVQAFVNELINNQSLIMSERQDGSRMQRRFETGYDDGVTRLKSWKNRLQQLEGVLSNSKLARTIWCQQVRIQTTSANESGSRRLSSSVLLAQAILIQLMGEDSAPQIKLVKNSTGVVGNCIQQPADIDSAINTVSDRLGAACQASTDAGYAWMTLGELVHIFSIDTYQSLPDRVTTTPIAPAANDSVLFPFYYQVPTRRVMQNFSSSALTDSVVQTGFALKNALLDGTLKETLPNQLSTLGVPDIAVFVVLLQTLYFSSPAYSRQGRYVDLNQLEKVFRDINTEHIDSAVTAGVSTEYSVNDHCLSYKLGVDKLSTLKSTLCGILQEAGFKPRSINGLSAFDYGDDTVDRIEVNIAQIDDTDYTDGEIGDALSELFNLASKETEWIFETQDGSSRVARGILPKANERNSYREQFGHIFTWTVIMQILLPYLGLPFIKWTSSAMFLGGDPLQAPAEVISSAMSLASIVPTGAGNVSNQTNISSIEAYALAILPNGIVQDELSLDPLRAIIGTWLNAFQGNYNAFQTADLSTPGGLVQVARQQTDEAMLGLFGANTVWLIWTVLTTGKLDMTGNILQNSGGGETPENEAQLTIYLPGTDTMPQNNTQGGGYSSYFIFNIMMGFMLAEGLRV